MLKLEQNMTKETTKGKREKCSLFDLGGDTLSYLFVVATVKELREVRNTLNASIEFLGVQIGTLYNLNQKTARALALVRHGVTAINAGFREYGGGR